MEPETTLSLAITAYVAKDVIAKVLGPTADYLGEGLRDFTKRRLQTIGRIFSNAFEKLDCRLDEPGQVPPRILKTVINEGSYYEDPLAVEYFGGVLASSRTELGRDDRGARVAKVIDDLSTYQLRTHYLLYSTIASLFSRSGKTFSTDDDRARMEVFLPAAGYLNSMQFSQEEWSNPQILHHVWHGLYSDNLIEGRWQFGDQQSLNPFSQVRRAMASFVTLRHWEWNSSYGRLAMEASLLSTCSLVLWMRKSMPSKLCARSGRNEDVVLANWISPWAAAHR